MPATADPVFRWLLAGDPSIRWQVLRDLAGAPQREVNAERARIATEGWGCRLLSLQREDGHWAGVYSPKWTSTTYTLLLLKTIGLAPGNSGARTGTLALLDLGVHSDNGINFWKRLRKCSETCVTGIILSLASRFATDDERVDGLVEYLLAEQMPDGGWNCLWRDGATHSSLHTTILALESLLEYETAGGRLKRESARSRKRAHEFLFIHRMFRSHRTGKVIKDSMTRFSFPPHWYYDVLRGLDYLRAAGAPKDERLEDAIELVNKRCRADGRWPLQNVHPGRSYFVMEKAGEPSRWNTLRAMRVLRWWSGC